MEDWEVDALIDETRPNGTPTPTLDDYTRALYPPPSAHQRAVTPLPRRRRWRVRDVASVCAASLALWMVTWHLMALLPVDQQLRLRIRQTGAGGGATPNCAPTVALTAAAIQSALGSASAGSTVCLPAGTLVVNSGQTITASPAANVTLMGQTVCTGAGQTMSCTDGTILDNNTGGKLFSLTPSTTGVYRQSGITYHSTTCTDHPLNVEGTSNTYRTVRFDHSHWYNYCNFNFEFVNARGVADHNLHENPTNPPGTNQNRALGFDDDVEWTHATNFGSQDFNWFYMEDSKWVRGISNDGLSSSRQVVRYSYLDNIGIQEHGTGHSGQNRGSRGLEVYNNTINGGSANTTSAISVYTGSAMVFNNAIDFSGGGVALKLVETRQSDYTYAALLTSRQPAGFSICGTNFDGTATVWDGNTDASGYPCLDQVGRGPGDLLSGNFSTKANSTRSCTVNFTWANRGANCDGTSSSAWPRQVLEPVYEWLNTGTAAAGWVNVFRDPGSGGGGIANIVQDRDFYVGHGNTNCNAGAGSCTAGVGSGTLANMPKNCTTGVAYFATDTNGLYKCVSTNSWRWYYSPLTYPHPVIGLLPANNYATNFPNVENPIAESNAAGSMWTNGSAAGGSLWGDIRTTAGNFVRGATQPTSFGDPTAILKGTWGATQGGQAVVHLVGTPAADSEVEIRLRTTITASTITGYEAYCSVAPADRYCHIASWGGPNGTYSNNETTCFTETHASSSCPARNDDNSLAYLVEGDTLSATVTGTNPVIIKLYINGIERERSSDDGTWTFNCLSAPCGSHGPWTSGAPGVGFFSTTNVFTTHGFTKFSVFGQ